jgi:pimeloyl-ACP methyl ester carboxylesterase
VTFVRVDGTALHVVRDGTSGPVVLFTQGLGGAWFDWDPVVTELADDFRLVRFDRPGLGWSQGEPPSGPPRPQTVDGEARRMARLLDALGFQGERVILVAHSYGGFHAEAFARLYPERTAGLVFADASVEPNATPTPDVGTLARRLPQAAVTACRRLGLNRLIGPAVRHLIILAASETHVDPDREIARRVYGSSRVAAATVNELTSYRDVAAGLLDLRREHAFPPVPVRVILGTAGRGAEGWVEAQRALAALSPHGALRQLPDAKHLIASDCPDAVAEAVADAGREAVF